MVDESTRSTGAGASRTDVGVRVAVVTTGERRLARTLSSRARASCCAASDAGRMTTKRRATRTTARVPRTETNAEVVMAVIVPPQDTRI
jgi:hypothetical protein